MKYSTKVILVYIALMFLLVYGTARYMGPKIAADNAKWDAYCKSKGGVTYQAPRGNTWICLKPHSVIDMSGLTY